MATVKFFLFSKSDSAPIYARLSIRRGEVYQNKTEYLCKADRWNPKKGMPIQSDPQLKNLDTNLQKLKTAILEQYNGDAAKGVTIDKEWFKNLLDLHFNKVAPEQLDYLTNRAQQMIDGLPSKINERDVHKRGLRIQPTTVAKYKNALNKVIKFEAHTKKKYLVKQVDSKWREQFKTFLEAEERLSQNTIGRYIKFIKTFVLYAQKEGAEISPQMGTFSGYTVNAPKVILDFEELDRIKKTPLVGDHLIIARDWLLIGCYVGQRVSDLLRMNKSMIQKFGKYDFLVITQKKTGATVEIPLHHDVREILAKYNGNFPPLFGGTNHDSHTALFNRYLKIVCREAGINEVVEGNLFNEATKRYDNGHHEKWKLVSSHICRRSFASNFYGDPDYPTPLLMNITGHKTERMFLEYIVDKRNKMSLELAKIWEDEAKEKPDTLTIVRSESQAV